MLGVQWEWTLIALDWEAGEVLNAGLIRNGFTKGAGQKPWSIGQASPGREEEEMCGWAGRHWWIVWVKGRVRDWPGVARAHGLYGELAGIKNTLDQSTEPCVHVLSLSCALGSSSRVLKMTWSQISFRTTFSLYKDWCHDRIQGTVGGQRDQSRKTGQSLDLIHVPEVWASEWKGRQSCERNGAEECDGWKQVEKGWVGGSVERHRARGAGRMAVSV